MYCKKLPVLLAATIGLFLSHRPALSAQVLKRDTIVPQKQVEVIHFSDDSEGRKSKRVSGQDIVKTAPLSFLLGYFPVFYEREFADWLGLQAGAGITFKPAVSTIQSELYSELFAGDCSGYDCSNYYDYSYRKAKTGYMLAFSPRLYFSSDGLDGSYIAPEVRLYSRSSAAQRPQPGNNYELVRLTDQFDAEKIRFTDLMVHYGWQELYPRLSLDISVGVGVRKISGHWQVIYQDNLGYYYSETPERSESRFRFDVGLRIGFQL